MFRASLASSCYSAAILHCPKLPPKTHQTIIPCYNGYLTFGDGEPRLLAPKAESGITHVISCAYSPDAPSPVFSKFILEILADQDVRNIVQEYVGYSLLGDTRHQTAQLWTGKGANGKGTLAEIVAALHHKTAALSIARLDGFSLAGIIGASLIYVDETPQRIDEQRLKTLISGDLIQIDRKYRDPLSFRPTAKWIVCANQIPSISDQTDGFWRRWQIVPFLAQFPEHQRIPGLAKQIIKEELSGVLNWAIEGLIRLLERGRFPDTPRGMLEAREAGKRETNSVLAWWSDVEPDIVPSARATEKSAVYSHYRFWCSENGMQPLAKERFWRRLGETEPNLEFDRIPPGLDPRRPRTCNLNVPSVPVTVH